MAPSGQGTPQLTPCVSPGGGGLSQCNGTGAAGTEWPVSNTVAANRNRGGNFIRVVGCGLPPAIEIPGQGKQDKPAGDQKEFAWSNAAKAGRPEAGQSETKAKRGGCNRKISRIPAEIEAGRRLLDLKRHPV